MRFAKRHPSSSNAALLGLLASATPRQRLLDLADAEMNVEQALELGEAGVLRTLLLVAMQQSLELQEGLLHGGCLSRVPVHAVTAISSAC